MSDEAHAALEERAERSLKDLRTLLAQRSISATGEGVNDCARMVRRLCLEYGFDEAEIVDTSGHPAVIAHAASDRPDEDDIPTVLLYGHYDVQPASPSEWLSPPFEPTIREGPDGEPRLYARGAGDNKGQWFAHLCAVKALRDTTGLPAHVVLLIEGEEESGSEHLEQLVRDRRDDFGADVAIVADGPIDSSGRPHVLLGARGLLFVDIDATGANRDLHSGNFGGPVPSPVSTVIDFIASLHDDGRVTLDGFYDDVRPLSDEDRAVLEAISVDEAEIKADLGLSALATDPGEGYVERLSTRPNLNVAGFDAGYGGEGMKTVLPHRARAKIDFRLVADQDPAAVFAALRERACELAPPGINLELTRVASMAPQRTPASNPIVDLVVRAVEDGWGAEPILKPALGGSVPTYVFADNLDVPCLVIPYANEDENNHAPDENLKLSCFHAGCRTTAALLTELADVSLE